MGMTQFNSGAMFWPWLDPLETIRLLKSVGATCGQLGMPGDADFNASSAATWRAASVAEAFPIATVFAAYDGESYADITTVAATVGLVPESTRAHRLERTLALIPFARIVGARGIACHIGFVPHDVSHRHYAAVRDMVRQICDQAAAEGLTFALETGQEPAGVLREFVLSVARRNLRINFDPANMILYGTGDPIAALELLAPWVETVHAKDGDWPQAAGQLGHEQPLGAGAVGMERFTEKLHQVGYRGALFVEREVEPLSARIAGIRHGIELLNRI